MTTRRRGRGEGSIFERADGRLVGTVDLGWRGGKRVRRSVTGRTRAEVRDRLDALRRSLDGGLTPPPARLTVGRFLADWLEVAAPKLRPRTLESYASHVRLHIAPAIGAVPLSKLGPTDVQRLLDGLSAGGLSPQTVAHVRATLRRALGQAERWGQVSRNVAKLVDPPRIETVPVNPLTGPEVRTFLEASRTSRFYPLWVTAIATGLRSGELRGVRWADIDMDAGLLQVRGAIGRVDGHLELVEPKTARSRRTVPLPAIAVDALREHRRRQLTDRLLAGARWQGERWGDLVFPTVVGTPFHDSTLVHRFHVDLAAAGIRRQRLHDLRHAAASLMLAQGVSARVVMETLGHSTIAVTMNTYAHVLPAAQRDAADRMQEVLTG
jgi:integrase